MKCSKARRWFGAYWDDEITQAERELLEAHFEDTLIVRGLLGKHSPTSAQAC